MATNFKIEDVDRLLNYTTIDIEPVVEGPGEFNRVRKFVVGNTEYKIEWYANMSYLICGALRIPFYYAKQSGTWPNNAKMNLQFYGRDEEVVAILKIDFHE